LAVLGLSYPTSLESSGINLSFTAKQEDVKMAENEFVERICAGLGRVYQQTLKYSKAIDLKTAKIVVFSDHHRGIRNGADDFRISEPAYHAALAHYFDIGHTLILLGDCEELWEEYPGPVVKVNAHSFELERKFHDDKRYFRVVGNHDDEWHDENRLKELLQPYYGPNPLHILDGLHLHIHDGDMLLGSIFLTHGHQGTKDSDFQLGAGTNSLAIFSKWAVRYLWRPFQRITKISVNTPAHDFSLIDHHDLAMYRWAASQRETILITGHTHKPVFASQDHLARLKNELADIKKKLQLDSQNMELLKQQDEIEEKIRIKAKEQKSSAYMESGESPKPCYFNAGCCSFSDGDVTGLEISDGMIRLVRWPDDQGKPCPKILDERCLSEILLELKVV
jgi:UDP-2,3-diacylglucosamine pyrophosphatase LpxH